MLQSSTGPAPAGYWRLSKDLVELIYGEIFEPLSDTDNPHHFHYILQRRLKALGKRLGYEARLEYPTPWIDHHKTGRVDVVWTAPDGGRSIAIEIDTCWRRKSITKLLFMAETHQPVWIFLGRRIVPHIPADHEMAKLHLIRVDPDRIRERPVREPKAEYSWRDVDVFKRRAARRRKAGKWAKAQASKEAGGR
jgi:hypothetical protein